MKLFVLPVADFGDELQKVQVPPEDGSYHVRNKPNIAQVRVIRLGNFIEPIVQFFFGFFNAFEIVSLIPELALEFTGHGKGPHDDIQEEEPNSNKSVATDHDCMFLWFFVLWNQGKGVGLLNL